MKRRSWILEWCLRLGGNHAVELGDGEEVWCMRWRGAEGEEQERGA
jgi:hypothetical protein